MAAKDSTPANCRRRTDLTGLRFGTRVVLGPGLMERNKHARWQVRCNCGREFSCLTQDLKRYMLFCHKCRPSGPRPWRRKRPYEAQYNAFVGRARFPVKISYEQFLGFTSITECHYCNAPIRWHPYRLDGVASTSSNLDRIDPERDYEMDNVVVCCIRCNFGKNDHFTYDQWKEIGKVIKSWGTVALPRSRASSTRRALAILQLEIEAEAACTENVDSGGNCTKNPSANVP